LLSSYKIFETDEFQKRVEKISKRDKIFIEKKLIQVVYPQLKEEPHFGNNIKKLAKANFFIDSITQNIILSPLIF